MQKLIKKIKKILKINKKKEVDNFNIIRNMVILEVKPKYEEIKKFLQTNCYLHFLAYSRNSTPIIVVYNIPPSYFVRKISDFNDVDIITLYSFNYRGTDKQSDVFVQKIEAGKTVSTKTINIAEASNEIVYLEKVWLHFSTRFDFMFITQINKIEEMFKQRNYPERVKIQLELSINSSKSEHSRLSARKYLYNF